MSLRSAFSVLTLTLFAQIGLCLTALPSRAQNQPPRWFEPAADFPDLTVTLPSGATQKLSEWRAGRPVVLTVWASWARRFADPAIFQGIEPVMKAHPRTEVEVAILRIVGEPYSAADERWLATHPMPYPVLGIRAKDLGLTSIPVHFFLNAEGTLAYAGLGFNLSGPDPLAQNLEKFMQAQERR
jgi:hypothetical protein